MIKKYHLEKESHLGYASNSLGRELASRLLTFTFLSLQFVSERGICSMQHRFGQEKAASQVGIIS